MKILICFNWSLIIKGFLIFLELLLLTYQNTKIVLIKYSIYTYPFKRIIKVSRILSEFALFYFVQIKSFLFV